MSDTTFVIELRPSTQVRSIAPTVRRLELATGERIGYQRLPLAAGDVAAAWHPATRPTCTSSTGRMPSTRPRPGT